MPQRIGSVKICIYLNENFHIRSLPWHMVTYSSFRGHNLTSQMCNIRRNLVHHGGKSNGSVMYRSNERTQYGLFRFFSDDPGELPSLEIPSQISVPPYFQITLTQPILQLAVCEPDFLTVMVYPLRSTAHQSAVQSGTQFPTCWSCSNINALTARPKTCQQTYTAFQYLS